MAGAEGRTGIVRVSGGPTSIMADLDDLEHACVGLERLDPAVETLRVPVRQWAEELPAHAETVPGVLVAVERLRDLEVDAVRLQELARVTAASVRLSVDGYRAAERGARHAVERAQYSAADAAAHVWEEGRDGLTVDEAERLVRNAMNSAGQSLLALAVSRGMFLGLFKVPGADRVRTAVDHRAAARAAKEASADGRDGRGLGERAWVRGRGSLVRRTLSDPVGTVAGWIMDGPVGDVYDEVVNWETAGEGVAALWGELPVEVVGEVEQIVGGPERLDGGVGSIIALQDQLRQAGPGRIGITRVAAADGEDSYIVMLPGTQLGQPLEPRHRVGADGAEYLNFADMAGIGDAVGHSSERTGDAVAAALAAAGVPDGARIVLGGHSQGGMHAVNLSVHPALSERYRVAGGYTYGAPSGNLEAAEGVPFLELVDEHDLVTALDGGPAPATADRTSVLLGSAPSVTGEEFRRYLQALEADHAELPEHLAGVGERVMEHHHLENYRRLVAAQEARGPEAWGEAAPTVAALGLLVGGQVVSQQTVPLGRRQPDPWGRPQQPEPPREQPRRADGR